jgi:hypothetical membrane protein
MKKLKLAGLLFFLGGSFVLMGIITAEAFYPLGYTTVNSAISDLGSTLPPESASYQPSATIFNTTMFVAGCIIFIATFLQHKHIKKFLFSIPLFLFGIGLVGVGLFPGNVAPYHGMSSMLAFLSGGVSAMVSFKIVSTPFNYIGIAFGFIALVTWFLAVLSPTFPISFIGIGGTERWVAYPIMLWVTALGGYLMNREKMSLSK